MKETNFKELWQGQESQPTINAAAIIAKARNLQRKTKLKIILGNLLLLVTMILIIGIVWYYEPQMLTTKIGALLVIIALVMQIIASAKLIPLLEKSNSEQSNSDYLQQLLLFKKKQFFIETTIMSVYFMLLGIGLGLYMIEYAMKLTFVIMILYCGLTALWMAFAWFYLCPRTIRKQRQKLNEVISQLENLENQLREN
jgi:hypothetical protein